MEKASVICSKSSEALNRHVSFRSSSKAIWLSLCITLYWRRAGSENLKNWDKIIYRSVLSCHEKVSNLRISWEIIQQPLCLLSLWDYYWRKSSKGENAEIYVRQNTFFSLVNYWTLNFCSQLTIAAFSHHSKCREIPRHRSNMLILKLRAPSRWLR